MVKASTVITLVLLLLVNPSILLPPSSGRVVNEVYRVPMGSHQGFEVWIVDGATIRRDIYPEFLFGDNSE